MKAATTKWFKSKPVKKNKNISSRFFIKTLETSKFWQL